MTRSELVTLLRYNFCIKHSDNGCVGMSVSAEQVTVALLYPFGKKTHAIVVRYAGSHALSGSLCYISRISPKLFLPVQMIDSRVNSQGVHPVPERPLFPRLT